MWQSLNLDEFHRIEVYMMNLCIMNAQSLFQKITRHQFYHKYCMLIYTARKGGLCGKTFG